LDYAAFQAANPTYIIIFPGLRAKRSIQATFLQSFRKTPNGNTVIPENAEGRNMVIPENAEGVYPESSMGLNIKQPLAL
jgi:hypothetical protein